MRLPSIKRLSAEQFSDIAWISRLLDPLNSFMEVIVQGLNNQLTIGENFDGVVKSVTVDGTYPVKFKWSRATRPTVAWIGYARELSGSHTNFSSALFLDWEFTGDGSFQINAIPGLSASASNKYSVRVIALAG